MTFKIQNFKGISPAISAELLPDDSAQICENVKFESGDLMPYYNIAEYYNTAKDEPVKTIFSLRYKDANDDDVLLWLSWLKEVNIVSNYLGEIEQRFYYTGDGVPKVSTISLARDGVGPLPNRYYELGVISPSIGLNISKTSIESSSDVELIKNVEFNTANRINNEVLITTNSPHGYKVGTIITVEGIGSSDIDDTDEQKEAYGLNATSVRIIEVAGAHKLTYYNSGDDILNPGSLAGATIKLSSATELRTYTYTYITPWGEESIAAPPSNELFIKNGQKVTIRTNSQLSIGLPSERPEGDNFIRGLRIYRLLSSQDTSEYFRLKTLWFPNQIVSVSLVDDPDTMEVVTEFPHNLLVGDRFLIASVITDFIGREGDTPGDNNIREYITVSEVIRDDPYRFIFNGPIIDIGDMIPSFLYHDASETEYENNFGERTLSFPRYWGKGSFTFIDDFNDDSLTEVLETDNHDIPNPDMVGLKLAHNGIMVGFFGNILCFSDIDLPHSWPEDYRIIIESKIISVTPISGLIMVLTTEYPYIVEGDSPEFMRSIKVDSYFPCVSSRSVVTMLNGIFWASHNGLVSYTPTGGTQLVTTKIHSPDTWNEDINPSTIIGHFYEEKYIAGHDNGSFIFEPIKGEGSAPLWTDVIEQFTSFYTDEITNDLYFIEKNTFSDIKKWDDNQQFLSKFKWKSKVFILPNYVNLGAFKIEADYESSEDTVGKFLEYNEDSELFNNGVLSGSIGGLSVLNKNAFNSIALNGSAGFINLIDIGSAQRITFILYVNKKLLYSTVVRSEEVMRLPAGYKSDTFEIEVEGSTRIRSIHVAETPTALRSV